ncbi:MAG: nuclear transport factor 2 family protein [Candidatus Levybacteria bacterium]|nr:nuclear transport factor 2 family protein [Candidatus Levybacteria bacterium]
MYKLDEKVFKKWMDTMGKAWTTKDTSLAVSLFDDSATYAATPYREVLKGKDAIHHYWESGMSTQEKITFDYEILAVKDNYGIAHAWGSMMQDGKDEAWDGIFWATFAENGKCNIWREWWVSK